MGTLPSGAQAEAEETMGPGAGRVVAVQRAETSAFQGLGKK